jgi:hypothetical protein
MKGMARHLHIERLDIGGQGEPLTLGEIGEEGKIEDLVEAVDCTAEILVRTRRVQPLQQQVGVFEDLVYMVWTQLKPWGKWDLMEDEMT